MHSDFFKTQGPGLDRQILFKWRKTGKFVQGWQPLRVEVGLQSRVRGDLPLVDFNETRLGSLYQLESE